MENCESILIPILCANNGNVLQVGFNKNNLRSPELLLITLPHLRGQWWRSHLWLAGSGTCKRPWEARHQFPSPGSLGQKVMTTLLSSFLASLFLYAG